MVYQEEENSEISYLFRFTFVFIVKYKEAAENIKNGALK